MRPTLVLPVLAWVLWSEAELPLTGKTAYIEDTFETKRACETAMAPLVAAQRGKGDSKAPKVRDIPGGAVFRAGDSEGTFRYVCLPSGTPPPGFSIK